MKKTSFIALFDLHIGWERGMVRGEWITRPTHNKQSIKAVLNFVKDFAPDVVLLGGDQLNAGPISHWHQGKPILDAGFRLKNEMNTLDELILTPFEKVKRKIYMVGNHDQWINDHVASNPGLAGLVEPEECLNLKKRKWEIYSQGEIAKIGKINFVHGDVCLGHGTGVNPARTLMGAYRRNIRAGHLHTFSTYIEKTAIDANDWHSSIVVPSLSTINPFFVKNNPTNFVNGFLVGWIWDDGEFSDQVILINNGVFTVNGKRYAP